MRAVLAALIAGCAIAVAGCSGAGTATPVAAATPAADRGDLTLAAGLLTSADLPLGFQPQDGAGAAAIATTTSPTRTAASSTSRPSVSPERTCTAADPSPYRGSDTGLTV